MDSLSVAPALLVVAHGTISSLDELPEFVARIRRGRPAPPELLAELRHRYEAIGGSPLLAVTEAQARAVGAVVGLPTSVAMRLSAPLVEDVLATLAAAGHRRAVVLPLAPYSVDVYHSAAVAAAERAGVAIELMAVSPWGNEPALVAAHVARLEAALALAPADTVVVTAHSLPLAVVRAGDRYPEEVAASVAAIQAALGRPLTLAYQSQSSGGEWLGPGLREVFVQAQKQGARRVLLSPIGFLAEHVETLYDLDVEAQGWARELGLELRRLPALGVDPGLVAAAAAVVQRALG